MGLILILICGASQQKLSFLLTGGLIGVWATFKRFRSKRNVTYFAVVIVILFFLPRSLWNLSQVHDLSLLSFITPLPDEFTNNLRVYREQMWWFPLNLIIPDSIGSVSAIIGIQVLLIFTFHSSDIRWREIICLCFLSSILMYVYGQSVSRSFYEYILW